MFMNEPVNKTPAVGATLVSLLASIGAAFAASCCVLPFVLSVAGIGGAWLALLTDLFPYRTYFLAAAAVALIVTGGLVMRRRRIVCQTECIVPTHSWRIYCALGISTFLVGLAAAWGWLEPLIMTSLMGIAAG